MKFPSLVTDVMNELICIDGESFVVNAAKTMIENKIGSIIVKENDLPVGIITRSDLIARIILKNRDPKKVFTREIMSSPLICIDSNTTILQAMRYIRDQDIHQVLIKKNNELIGIVSEGDLISAVTLSSLTQFSTILRKK